MITVIAVEHPPDEVSREQAVLHISNIVLEAYRAGVPVYICPHSPTDTVAQFKAACEQSIWGMPPRCEVWLGGETDSPLRCTRPPGHEGLHVNGSIGWPR